MTNSTRYSPVQNESDNSEQPQTAIPINFNSPAPSYAPVASSSSSSSSRIPLAQTDGVFSNLSAKPSAVKDFQEIEPPSYESTEQAPPYFEATVAATFAEDGEVLVEGMEVGNVFTLVINAVVSCAFDFIGFLLTSMLATSHAARCGSRIGLGITMVRYGIVVKTRDVNQEAEQYRYYDPDTNETPEGLAQQNQFVSYLLLIIGMILITHANFEFYRAHRLRRIILSNENAM